MTLKDQNKASHLGHKPSASAASSASHSGTKDGEAVEQVQEKDDVLPLPPQLALDEENGSDVD